MGSDPAVLSPTSKRFACERNLHLQAEIICSNTHNGAFYERKIALTVTFVTKHNNEIFASSILCENREL